MTDADALLKEVIENHIYVGYESNWCIFCGRWPEEHEEDCIVLRIREYFVKLNDSSQKTEFDVKN